MHILANSILFQGLGKPILKFNTFSLPRGNPEQGFPTWGTFAYLKWCIER